MKFPVVCGLDSSGFSPSLPASQSTRLLVFRAHPPTPLFHLFSIDTVTPKQKLKRTNICIYRIMARN